ncbi:leucine-rich repeat flightless-interacting protein 1 isoform X2 [Acanthochromis polyacanthus]|uniref:leucine-rich repeat flightless-interacting protein 1 isoform X2 n=1 Tax=Acanthochromis polyacanthus TaxID=80966 RepID=UPI000B8EF55D|nr:leucine-rich repeat flightless-interacting protein 1 isoform X2 [Acanthochromis polyacanthus]
MHSVTLDSSGSPKKRTFSRGISEDESLRSIIKETESSSRRLNRSDSRAGTLKKRSDSQLELQASYDEAVQELRGLEVEREALLFQVDVLQDTLEGVEELLAEARREAGQASLELEREREAKRKLESMVSSLMQEVERLKEERNNKPPAPENTIDEAARRGHQIQDDAKELIQVAHREEKNSLLCEPDSSIGDWQATKLRRIVSKPLGHPPSLALDNLESEDGVHQRPYENGIVDGRDPSPDRNDSDSISAYEDASDETPEQDRFPELPDDSQDKQKNPTNDGEIQDSRNSDSCILS